MASHLHSKSTIDPSSSSIFDDDDFQDYPSPSLSIATKSSLRPPLKPHNSAAVRPSKKLKKQDLVIHGKENILPIEPDLDLGGGLDSIELTPEKPKPESDSDYLYANHSIESRLLKFRPEEQRFCEEECPEEESTQLDLLLELCAEVDKTGTDNVGNELEEKSWDSICCPICGANISELSDDMRQVHTNQCLDKVEVSSNVEAMDDDKGAYESPGQVVDTSPLKSTRKAVDVSPVVEWLQNLGLAKYGEIFVREEIDWDALQWLTEEDLCSIGVAALGPRKKIVHALKELRNDSTRIFELKAGVSKAVPDDSTRTDELKAGVSKALPDDSKLGTNKLITDFFSGPHSSRRREDASSNGQNNATGIKKVSTAKKNQTKPRITNNGKRKEVPPWCCIPGTPFRVDAFKYLRRDCTHWFLTHFHLDHYQGLTRSFSHGTIYCSSITAKLINLKIGIAWEKIQVLPLNQKINIAGIDVMCFDANHCPGAIIILFEPPNGKPVLHTGDFRFDEEMSKLSILQARPIHTLILDTTYCDPQYDFPKQDAVIQFVIDAIQAEAFNPKTLFLIGSYTIGKERLFVEAARALHKKIYVSAAKLRLLECLGLAQEDMQWFTLNELESHIHVVPMWTIASFKRLKHLSNQYMDRFSLIVAFSPTGWTFGKGKKSTGRRWQQGTIIRYEVPYSEHSSFSELRDFVKFISPLNIIPSVNNDGPDSHNSMVSQLLA